MSFEVEQADGAHEVIMSCTGPHLQIGDYRFKWADFLPAFGHCVCGGGFGFSPMMTTKSELEAIEAFIKRMKELKPRTDRVLGKGNMGWATEAEMKAVSGAKPE